MYSDEFLANPKRIYQAFGLWPQASSTFSYKLKSVCTFSCILTLTICLSYNTTYHSDNIIELSESLYMLISVVNSLLKSIMVSVNEIKLLALLGMTNIPRFTQYQDIYGSVIRNLKKTFKKVEIVYWIQVNGTLIFCALFPAFEGKALPMNFPHFNNGTFHYPFYVVEIVTLCVAAYANMTVDLLTVAFISIAVVQLQILNRKLIDTDRNVQLSEDYSKENVEKLTLEYLNECCQHYSDIEKFVKCFLEVFSVNIFVQLGSSVVAICNSGMMILTVELVSIEAVSLFFYMAAMCAQLGMYCWFGNLIYYESLEVSTSCYMSNWYEHGTAVRKTLFMLMERSKRPLELRGLKFVTLSFNTFVSILKCSYSYFTLLRNYTMK